MTDYEIYKSIKMKPISDICDMLSIDSDNYDCYGKYQAKIDIPYKDNNSKLILVTSTNPTPYGEGKTTISIGICDVLNKNGYKSILALREPSLGPVFGIKGGACGGGYSQIVPMDNINLHFTGDFHAITAANNLISAVIDNHIFQGNELDIKEVYFERCLDVNDIALRNVVLSNGRNDKFSITAACEIMAVFCLASSFSDLRKRIGDIIVGVNSKGDEIYVSDLGVTGAVLALLKDAFKPNLVQTLYHNPAVVHGGPFANIAHGCNSVVALKTCMALGDYVITEAGFGSDMGGVKFFDIMCKSSGIYPDMVVVNSTIRSLKYNGNGDLKEGIKNLEYHILNMKKFNDNVLVIVNKFNDDSDDDINFVRNFCHDLGVKSVVSDMYTNGEDGNKEIADLIVNMCKNSSKKVYSIYEDSDDIFVKIDKLCKDIYYAGEVKYLPGVKEKLEKWGKLYPDFSICVSKTQYSISDDPKKLGFPKGHTMTVSGVKLNHGAKFITLLMGGALTMPGLGKKSNYLNIDVVDDSIVGLF